MSLHHICLGVMVGALLGLVACGGGGGSGGSFDSNNGGGTPLPALSVTTINDTLARNGLTGNGTRLVLTDGLGNSSGQVDINQVFVTRVRGNSTFFDDIAFAFDVLNKDASRNPFNNATPVLYLDTDLNAGTGMPIKGIGADVRLAHRQPGNLTSGYATWQAVGGVWQPLLTFSSQLLLNRFDGGYHAIVIVDGTSGLLTSTNTLSVLAMDVLDANQSTVRERYDSTQVFTLRPF